MHRGLGETGNGGTGANAECGEGKGRGSMVENTLGREGTGSGAVISALGSSTGSLAVK